MSKPAGVGDTSHGQTAFFVTYYCLPNNAYTDSVGLGDNRFKAEDVVGCLKSILKNSAVGYNKVYICVQYGRISSDTRHYLDLITTIFGDHVLQWCSIIFTRCSDQAMTKEKYLTKNNEDDNMIKIINQVKSVIFGDNMTDEDPDMEAILLKRREKLLTQIKKDLEETANKEYFKLERMNLLERLRRIIQMMFGQLERAYTISNDIISFAKAASIAMQSSNYINYFGECAICTEEITDTDTDTNEPVITICNHVHHKVCLEKWIKASSQTNCPLCRAKLNDSQNECYTILTFKE
ncbi:unnamed protein product [Rotaria magnacalcarata]|uniref:RING-type domain-containing protein n=2 Tax=Rotaria magnacalcarata TaxID=392030 RepID=A0A819IVV4_9BILA|nr:unnamed protein product [Rotaria magnacalcarata]CAF2139714.1 unnamed protein product [Rotaria magnacalcarata]CAF2159618.1 unnamed protein product [Rotaria magnacalcarata]CAF3917948.1 unnamed protein product [Rotaria magnacalcarata]CAF3986419.1 unnamed protein product [Rotaria magnacalcarata]